jgi:beta-glucanase (GH16 family)
MRRPFPFLVFCSLLFSLLFAGKSKDRPAPQVHRAATKGSTPYRLVWSDEFNTNGLPDNSKWSYDRGGWGWGNDEEEYYTHNRPENARIENGCLVIEARKEKWQNREYTSARLVTKNKGDWQYGRIEVRAKLPRGRGLWPAIWTLGTTYSLNWPDDGEIDIMEELGFDPGVVHATVQCKKYNFRIGTQKTALTTVPDYMSAFHVYAMEWNADSVSIFVDDHKYFSFINEHTGHDTWPFDHPMHLILDIAVGGNWGGRKGIDDSIFPQQMLIDYVRVYQ